MPSSWATNEVALNRRRCGNNDCKNVWISVTTHGSDANLVKGPRYVYTTPSWRRPWTTCVIIEVMIWFMSGSYTHRLQSHILFMAWILNCVIYMYCYQWHSIYTHSRRWVHIRVLITQTDLRNQSASTRERAATEAWRGDAYMTSTYAYHCMLLHIHVMYVYTYMHQCFSNRSQRCRCM